MQYNYPLSEKSITLIKEIMNTPNDGFLSSLHPALAIILFIVSCLAIPLLVVIVEDRLIDSSAGVLMPLVLIVAFMGLAIGIFFTHMKGGGPEQRFKNELIDATSDSWSNTENYSEFQSNIQRYLQSQNIDLEKQCESMSSSNNVLEVEDSKSRYNNDYDAFNIYIIDVEEEYDPNHTIICSSSSKNLAGTVKFKDNNNKVVYYDYNTSVNDNNEYAIFTLNEKQEEE